MTVVFALVGLLVLVASLFTVRSTKLVHAVLWLGVTLGATAVLFVQLGAPFLAGIQLLLYVGGVMTLMIFGVMLTRRAGDGELRTGERSAWRSVLALLGALALFAVLAGGIVGSTSLMRAASPTGDPAVLGKSLLTTHLLAFEALSALLLASMIGAIVLARRRDPDAPAGESKETP